MKKFLKISVLILSILTILIVIFRNPIYLTSVEYRAQKLRSEQKITNQQFIDIIETKAKGQDLNTPDAIVDFSQKLAADKLIFSLTAKKKTAPNSLLDNNETNCVGYAKFCAAVCNYLFEKQKLKQYKAMPMVAKIYLFGNDIHQYIDNPYFRDHDFVTVINFDNKTEINFDPSLYDYIRINRINSYMP